MAVDPFETLVRVDIYQNRVLKVIEAKRRRILYRTGGYGRKVVATSMPRKPKKAMWKPYREYLQKPVRRGFRVGRPPYRDKGEIKDKAEFAVDLQEGSFLVGVHKHREQNYNLLGGISTIPQLFNEGGKQAVELGKKVVVLDIKPHPITTYGPSYNKIADAFQNNIKTIGLT